MKHLPQTLILACLTVSCLVLGACNRPPPASSPPANGIPHVVGSGQSPGPAPVVETDSGDRAPATAQYAVLKLDPKLQKKNTEDDVEAKKEATSSLAGNDLNFIQRVANDGQSEEQAALYVASKTTNSEVRNYAAQMGRDHGKANQQLRKIAATRKVETPSDPSGQLREKLDRLRQLSGPEMEQAFLKDFGVQAHRDSIALFETQAAQSTDKELKEFAAKQLPVLRRHYEEGKALLRTYVSTVRNI